MKNLILIPFSWVVCAGALSILLLAGPAMSQTRPTGDLGVSALVMFGDHGNTVIMADVGASLMFRYVGLDANFLTGSGESIFMGGLLLGTNSSKSLSLFGEIGMLTGAFFEHEHSWILGVGFKYRPSPHVALMFRGLSWAAFGYGSLDLGFRFVF